jgi:hypothetical protein
MPTYLQVGEKILPIVGLKGECTCLFGCTLLSIVAILKGNDTPVTCWLIVAKGITLELV